jgi:hypothetical protein
MSDAPDLMARLEELLEAAKRLFPPYMPELSDYRRGHESDAFILDEVPWGVCDPEDRGEEL